jgi:hypothetical protein
VRNANRELNSFDLRSAERCDEFGSSLFLNNVIIGLLIIEADTIVPALRYTHQTPECQTFGLARRRSDIVGGYQLLSKGRGLPVSPGLVQWNAELESLITAAASSAHFELPDSKDAAAIDQLQLIVDSQVSVARTTLSKPCGTRSTTTEVRDLLFGPK